MQNYFGLNNIKIDVAKQNFNMIYINLDAIKANWFYTINP